MFRKALVAVLALFLMASVVGCGGGGNGEDVAGVVEVTVNSVETTKEDQWGELKPGQELVVVGVTITNGTDQDYEFNPNHVQLDVGGRMELSSDKRPKDREMLSSVTIEPGETITGIVAFEVEENTQYEVWYDDLVNKIKLQ